MTGNRNDPSLPDFENVYNAFFLPNEVTEIRTLGVTGKSKAWEGYARNIVSGYFNNPIDFAKAALALDQAGAIGVYFTLNPVNPALLGRAHNRLKVLKATTSDRDVLCLRWLYEDFDPVRPAEISSTDEEIEQARLLSSLVFTWLQENGFPPGLKAFSGNGYHNLLRLPDFPNDEEHRSLIKRMLQALSGRFSTEKVKIDESVFNPARIIKLYGTYARKGDNTVNRPYRRSYLNPECLNGWRPTPLSKEQMLWLTGQTQEPKPKRQSRGAGQSNGLFDVRAYLEHYGRRVVKIKKHDSANLYCLEHCIFDDSHRNNESSIGQTEDRRLFYQCFHDHCKGRTWSEARELISGTDLLTAFMGETEKGEAKSGGSCGSYGSYSNDSDIIFPVEFPFCVFPHDFQNLIQTYSTALQIEPELVALIKMGVLSGAIGNTFRVSVKEGWTTPLFLWIAYIAESGYGKSPAQNAILQPVKRFQSRDTDRYKAELKTYESSLRKAKGDNSIEIPEKPRATQKLVSDVTIEALADVFEHDGRGIIADRDELSGFVLSFNQYRSHGGDDRQKWLSLFNCDPLKIDRKSGTRFVKNTGIAIIGGIQPKILPAVFSEKAFEDGLLPRFLLYRAEDGIFQFNRQGISENVREEWESLVTRCYEIPCEHDEYGFIKPKMLILNGEALDLWEAFYNEYGQIAPFLSEKERVFVPKLISYYSLKFAGILHVLKCINAKTEISLVIHEEVIKGAITLTRFFMWQVMNVLKLYRQDEERFTECQKRVITTMYDLQDEVKNGKLPLDRIKATLNEALPKKLRLTSEAMARMLKDLGLTTKKSTGNFSHLIWEQGKLQELFSEISLTTLTTLTEKEVKRATEINDVNEIKVNDTEQKETADRDNPSPLLNEDCYIIQGQANHGV